MHYKKENQIEESWRLIVSHLLPQKD